MAAPPGREAPARAVPLGMVEVPAQLRQADARGQAAHQVIAGAVGGPLVAAQVGHPVVSLAAVERRAPEAPGEPHPLVPA